MAERRKICRFTKAAWIYPQLKNKEIAILKSSLEDIEQLKYELKKRGVSVGKNENGYFVTVNSREEYFKENYKGLKKRLAQLHGTSLEDFSSITPYTFTMNNLCEDKCGTYIYADGELMPLDRFVRRCLVGEKYYIGGVVRYYNE